MCVIQLKYILILSKITKYYTRLYDIRHISTIILLRILFNLHNMLNFNNILIIIKIARLNIINVIPEYKD